MNIDFLKPVLGDELYQQVVDALKGKDDIKLVNLASGEYVRKDKYDGDIGRLTKANESMTDEVKTLQSSLKEVEKSTGNVEKIKSDAAKALEDSKEKIKSIQAESAKETLDYEVRLAVIKAGAKDEKSVIAHLDMEIIKLTDGQLSGLNEQLTSLVESHKYLFGEPKKIFKSEPHNPPPPEKTPEGDWNAKYKAALESGDNKQIIQIKQEAYAEGVILN